MGTAECSGPSPSSRDRNGLKDGDARKDGDDVKVGDAVKDGDAGGNICETCPVGDCDCSRATALSSVGTFEQISPAQVSTEKPGEKPGS